MIDPFTIFQLVNPWLARLPDMIGNELNTRGTIRVRREETRLNIQLEEHRAALTRTIMLERHEHDAALHRLQLHSLHYPLGVPGRFLGSGSRQQPAILVSPPPCGMTLPVGEWATGGVGIDELAYDGLREAPGITRYADLLTGAFVRDQGVPRAIRGVGDAREIAVAEFPLRPAVIIYFERHSTGLTAFAYLASLFATVDGDAGFPIRVAKFVLDGDPAKPPVALPQDTDLPTWQLIDLSGWQGPRGEVVAAVIGCFILATLDAYWLLQGVPGTGLLASVFSSFQEADFPRQAVPALAPDPITVDGPFLRRLGTEMTRLAQAGFALEVAEFGDQRVALLAVEDRWSIAFIMGEDYPMAPPLVLTLSAEGQQRFDIAEDTWTPDRNLLEIAESLV
jgi:hypothetical protein